MIPKAGILLKSTSTMVSTPRRDKTNKKLVCFFYFAFAMIIWSSFYRVRDFTRTGGSNIYGPVILLFQKSPV